MATYKWIGTTSTWSTGSNWSPSGPPANGDTAIFDGDALGAVAGSDESAVTLALLNIKQSFIALGFNFGSTTTPLKILSALVRIGDPNLSTSIGSTGTGNIILDLGTTATVVTVINTHSSSADGDNGEPLRIKAVNTSNVLTVQSGIVGVATNATGDVATFGTVSAVAIPGQSTPTVNLASGVTINTSVDNNGADVNTFGAVPQIQNFGGNFTTKGTALIGIMVSAGGTIYAQHRVAASGTCVTTLKLWGGTVDVSGDARNLIAGATSIRSGAVHTLAGNFTPGTVTYDFDGSTSLSFSKS